MRLFKRILVLASAAFFLLSLSAYLKASEERTRPISSAGPSAGASQGYCLRSEGDRLYVLPLSGGEAVCIGGVRVSDLPDEDRRQLAAGLTVPDDEALLALLEDYTG